MGYFGRTVRHARGNNEVPVPTVGICLGILLFVGMYTSQTIEGIQNQKTKGIHFCVDEFWRIQKPG